MGNDNETNETETEVFIVKDEATAQWVVNKMLGFTEQRARVTAQAAAMLAQIETDRSGFEWTHGLALEQWTLEEIERRGGKRKSLVLLTGTIGFRKKKGGVQFVDRAAVLDWACDVLPDEVETKTTMTIGKTAIGAHIASTGEIPPGVEIVESSEGFYVKAAKKAES